MNDLISRQALQDAMYHEAFETDSDMQKWDGGCWIRYKMFENVVEALPSAQQWIPIKMRPMDAEVREYWEDHFGYELADKDAVLFDCQMPDDGQEILVSYRKWIGMDKCEIDGGCYGLEGNGDWEDVIAWMPAPEPYKEEKENGI